MQILKSNFRFFRNHFSIILLNVGISCAGIVASAYLCCLVVAAESGDFHRLIAAIFISAAANTFYILLQDFTLKLRFREIFIRKWYGGKARDIFRIIFTGHLMVVGVILLVAILAMDILRQSFFYTYVAIDLSVFYLFLSFNVAVLLIAGGLNLRKISDIKIADLLVKIS